MRGTDTDKGRRAAERLACKGVRMTFREEQGFFAGLVGAKYKDSKPVPVRNLSRDGLCFLSRREFKPGEHLSMTIRLGSHGPTVQAEGEAQWCSSGEGVYSYKVGVGFTDVRHADWDVLGHLEEILRKENKDWTRWRLRSKKRASRPFGVEADDRLAGGSQEEAP